MRDCTFQSRIADVPESISVGGQLGDYIEITAMKLTLVRVCPGGTPRPLRLYAAQRMA